MFLRRIRWIFLLLSVLFLLAFGPAAVFGRTPPGWVPESLRNWAFDVRLTIAPIIIKAQSISYGSFADDRIYIDEFGQSVEFQSEGLKIAGTLYKPNSVEGNHPGVLLLHGSTPEGRKLGLYRMLGKSLSEKGYYVLSIDQRAFGDSSDPPTIATFEDLSPLEDAKKAVSYLSSIEGVGDDQIFVIGHSGGADVAITVGIEDSRINRIVAIGPSRRVAERTGGEDAPEQEYFLRRNMRYMDLDEPIPEDILLQRNLALPLENHLDYFSKPGHKPLLLIDGELEGESDRIFLREIVEMIVEPKEYITLLDADHYANVANFGPAVIYDRKVTEALVDAIHKWLSSE
jgi:pimeloyl-ACP methyl ester carboxylesterase